MFYLTRPKESTIIFHDARNYPKMVIGEGACHDLLKPRKNDILPIGVDLFSLV